LFTRRNCWLHCQFSVVTLFSEREKNEQANIGPKELAALQLLAADLLGLTTKQVNEAVAEERLFEISDDDESESEKQAS